jgi:hypothetical protein
MSAQTIAGGICLGFVFVAIGKVVCDIVAKAFSHFWGLVFLGWEAFGLYRLVQVLNGNYHHLIAPDDLPNNLGLWAMMFVGLPLALWGFARLEKGLGSRPLRGTRTTACIIGQSSTRCSSTCMGSLTTLT